MNETEIFHGIQRIALFMGWTPDEVRIYLTVKYPNNKTLGKLNYYNDWNLLMPVVHRIFLFLESNFLDDYWKCKGIYWKDSRFRLMTIATPIENVFEEVVKFIEWYEQNKMIESNGNNFPLVKNGKL